MQDGWRTWLIFTVQQSSYLVGQRVLLYQQFWNISKISSHFAAHILMMTSISFEEYTRELQEPNDSVGSEAWTCVACIFSSLAKSKTQCIGLWVEKCVAKESGFLVSIPTYDEKIKISFIQCLA